MSKKAWAKLIVFAVVAILFIVLLGLNAGQSAQIHLIFRKDVFPLMPLMLITFLFGFITGILTTFRVSANQKKKK